MKPILIAVLLSVAVVSCIPVFAHPHSGTTAVSEHSHTTESEIVPLDATIGIEKTTLYFHASDDNTLPWGHVKGKIKNHVSEYPVIIQMFTKGDPVHFAQTDVSEDGSYEYKFRVSNVKDGELSRSFVGDYTVIVYKVVYLESNFKSA